MNSSPKLIMGHQDSKTNKQGLAAEKGKRKLSISSTLDDTNAHKKQRLESTTEQAATATLGKTPETLLGLPDELIERCIFWAVKTDRPLVSTIGNTLEMAKRDETEDERYYEPKVKLTAPFQGIPKLEEIAEDQVYKADVFEAHIYGTVALGPASYFADLPELRPSIRHLDVEICDTDSLAPVTPLDLTRPEAVGADWLIHIPEIARAYPSLETLSLSFVKLWAIRPMPSVEVVGLEAFHFMSNLLTALKAVSGPRLKAKTLEVTFIDPRNNWLCIDHDGEPVRIEGRNRDLTELMSEALCFPRSSVRL